MSRPTFRASNTPQGLTENMQILTGQKGDRLDKALTLRDAANLGMLNLRRTPGGTVVPELPPSNHVDPEWSGVQPPHAPLNVSVSGAFHTIVLSWDAPTYRGTLLPRCGVQRMTTWGTQSEWEPHWPTFMPMRLAKSSVLITG